MKTVLGRMANDQHMKNVCTPSRLQYKWKSISPRCLNYMLKRMAHECVQLPVNLARTSVVPPIAYSIAGQRTNLPQTYRTRPRRRRRLPAQRRRSRSKSGAARQGERGKARRKTPPSHEAAERSPSSEQAQGTRRTGRALFRCRPTRKPTRVAGG